LSKLDLANTAYFITSVAYISRLLPVSGQCITATTRLLNDLKISKDVTALYNYTPPNENIAKLRIEQPIKKIDLKNVSYAYEDNRLVLENFSYRFEAGSIYCLAGDSGRGKSTILDLLLKFRKPKSGKILFNGLDVNEIETASLRSKAIYLDQKYSIFNDTLENNLTLGSTYSSEQIKNAVDSSKLRTLVDSKTQGLKTIIEYQGANLSGGQKQRIILARAFLRNPDVLILDETLSGLDQSTKEEIFSSIRNLFSGKIIIIVSHDKWVIENSDLVLMM
jgi:ABC-type bacteriocin/lantibiotic exporter with double-glycine peptidase domain